MERTINGERKMKKRCVFLVCLAVLSVLFPMVWLSGNRTYGMELGGFEIEIGVGTGEMIADSENGNEEVPEIESETEAEPVPGIEYKPEVEYVPEVECEPEVEYVPETNLVPEVEYEPKMETMPEIEDESNVESVPKEEDEPKVKFVPEVNNKSEINYVPPQENKPIENTIPHPQTESVNDTEKLKISPVITKMEVTPAMELLIDDKQVELLEYFEEETIAEKEKLKPFLFEKQMKAGEIITVQVNGKQPIYILSLRINEKECTWEFTDGKIIVKNETGMSEISIKLMYLSIKEDIHMILTEE